MNYGEIKTYDIANGPGVRVTLFVSGCQKEDPEFDAWCDRVIAALEKAKKEV